MVDIYVRRVGAGFLLSFWHRPVARVAIFPSESYFSLSCSSPSRSHSQSLLQSHHPRTQRVQERKTRRWRCGGVVKVWRGGEGWRVVKVGGVVVGMVWETTRVKVRERGVAAVSLSW